MSLAYFLRSTVAFSDRASDPVYSDNRHRLLAATELGEGSAPSCSPEMSIAAHGALGHTHLKTYDNIGISTGGGCREVSCGVRVPEERVLLLLQLAGPRQPLLVQRTFVKIKQT